MIFLPSYYYFGFNRKRPNGLLVTLPDGLDHICYNPIDHYWFMSSSCGLFSIYRNLWRADASPELPNPPSSPAQTVPKLTEYMNNCLVTAKHRTHDLQSWLPHLTPNLVDAIDFGSIVPQRWLKVFGYFIDGTRIYDAWCSLDISENTHLDKIPANQFRAFSDIDHQRHIVNWNSDINWTIHWWEAKYQQGDDPDFITFSSDDNDPAAKQLCWDSIRLCSLRLSAAAIFYGVGGLKCPGIKTIYIDTKIDELGRFRNQTVCERAFIHTTHWFSHIQPNQHDGWGLRIPEKLLSPGSWHNSLRVVEHLFESGEL